MSNKALITKRDVSRSDAEIEERRAAENLGCTAELCLPQGTLIRGDAAHFNALEAQGFRVKVLRDTNVLRVGSYRIDIDSDPPQVRQDLEVPTQWESTWPHHLVQLTGPQIERWVRAIEEQEVEVVEPISSYGLFVVGSPEAVDSLADLKEQGESIVAWAGPFKPAYRLAPGLREKTGLIRYVNIGVYPASEAPGTQRVIEEEGGRIIDEWAEEASYPGGYHTLVVELPASRLAAIACLPYVRWLEFQAPDLESEDERSSQIIAGNVNADPPPDTAPVRGYQEALTRLGLSGAGVVIGICDSGVDTHDNATMHPDLRGRMRFFVDLTSGGKSVDELGHGTHVAGIAVGNAASGDKDPGGFLLGQGVAPGASFGSINPVGGPGINNVAQLTRLLVNHGAHIMNNSWRQKGSLGYSRNAALVDKLVRDPNEASATLDYLTIVFSAGNRGPRPRRITPPKEAKNPIVVGASLTFRPGGDDDDIRGVLDTSSRGPARDKRILPTIVAPGADIVSTRSQAACTPPFRDSDGVPHWMYRIKGGTSSAAPHVSGLCALLIEWWRRRTNGRNPSPAMLKALLINGADDIAGGPSGRSTQGLDPVPIPIKHIPNNDQGWGRANLKNMLLQAPETDRGPKLLFDQQYVFTADGQEYVIQVAPVNASYPLRITVVWTDAPGAQGTNPALVNNLNLEVIEKETGAVYKGNVFKGSGFSKPGGDFDDRNNVECVYLQHPRGIYEIRIIACVLAQSAYPDVTTPWQDFALVIDNAEVASATPKRVVSVLDHVDTLVSLGYKTCALTICKQLVDLTCLNDQVGVVKVGRSLEEESVSGTRPILHQVTGQPVRDEAIASLDRFSPTNAKTLSEGLAQVQDWLSPTGDPSAVILLSDGHDQSRLPGSEVWTNLAGTMPIHPCALGPVSNQTGLYHLAEVTGGRYFYTPQPDNLFEVHNYIRGQTTGEAIVANETMQTDGCVAAFVDALSTKATFTVAWSEAAFRYVSEKPKDGQICIQLYDPRERLVHPNSSFLRRREGNGYFLYEVLDPAPGQWIVKVTTAEGASLHYTVACFVKSSLRSVVLRRSGPVAVGTPLIIGAQVFDGTQPIKGFRGRARIQAPAYSLDTLRTKFAKQLEALDLPSAVFGQRVPRQIAQLLILRNTRLSDGQSDLFNTWMTSMRLREVTVEELESKELAHWMHMDTTPIGFGEARSERSLHTNPESLISGVVLGQFVDTQQRGSYNVFITLRGMSPVSNTRFVRKEMISILVN